jgi:hypothetical protein
LARVEKEDSVQTHLVFDRQDSQAEERGDQPRIRRRLKNLHQTAGVIAVRVGQIDPPQVGWLDLRPDLTLI